MICILMSTYNGACYIEEQIKSLLGQEKVSFQIVVRDDGSADGTRKILDRYQGEVLQWYQGENLGPGFSFLELLKRSPEADYYAFCDQDDVWDACKLYQAQQLLDREDKNRPLLYYSNVNVTDSDLNYMETSNIEVEYNNLKHVLMHSSGIGCTMVMNNMLRNQINAYAPAVISMHDWWAHKLCLVLGGKVLFDRNAYVSYRQHGSNAIGFHERKRSLWERLFVKTDCMVSRTAKEILKGYGNQMEPDVKTIVTTVALYRENRKCKKALLMDNSFYRERGKALLLEKIAVIRNRK